MRTATLKRSSLMGALLIACASASWADSGSFTMTNTERDPILMAENGHMIYVSAAKGTAKGGDVDGARVTHRELVDITQGNGVHQGYTTFTKGGNKEIVKWSGKINTTLNDDGSPNTTFAGKWTTVYGTGPFKQSVGDSGTYEGQMTSQDSFIVKWQES